MAFNVIITEKEVGVYTVSPFGAVDSTTYAVLEKELSSILKPATRVIIFDMQDVNYISSMGIGVILKTKKTLEQNKGSLVLTNLQPPVKAVFDIIKALPSEAVFTSLEEVDAYFSDIQKRESQKNTPF